MLGIVDVFMWFMLMLLIFLSYDNKIKDFNFKILQMNEYKPNSEGSSVPSNSEPQGKPATKKSSQGTIS